MLNEINYNAAFFDERKKVIKSWLNLENTFGLEIAPLWMPLIAKHEGKIHYCDRISYEELVKREKDNADRIKFDMAVVPIDFICKDNKKLAQCTQLKYDYILSSHVLEHVPDFLGFLYQQRAVLKDNGTIAFVLPDIRRLAEPFRPPTTAAQIINAYLMRAKKPTPGQVYEALRHTLNVSHDEDFIPGKRYEDYSTHYTKEQTIAFAKAALNQYLDVHCWAFNIDSFQEVVKELQEVGMFDFDIVDIKLSKTLKEFYVKLKPNKPPRKEPSILMPLLKEAARKLLVSFRIR